MKRQLLAVIVSPLIASPALAIAPGEQQRGFVDGANHHIGDASFLARFGRAPDAHDSEKLRMHTHLAFMHDWLAIRPATRPELAQRRAEILGYLEDYITRDITPHNDDLPYRNPVFVDELGHICAVGYLIQQSGHQDLVDDIVATDRFALLDDIDLPGMAEWIAQSGFTPEELAAIQPGYVAPMVEQWRTWDIAEKTPSDGAWRAEDEEVITRGAWKHGQMDGTWTRTDAAGRVIGRGDFTKGRAAWTSYGEHGEVLAAGPFVDNHPHGAWTFYHPSGRVAAAGRFTRGARDGQWTFYYDATEAQPIARGAFKRGSLVGSWSHFGPDGALIAKTASSTVQGEQLNTLRTPAGPDGTHMDLAAGTIGGDGLEVWALRQGQAALFYDKLEGTWHDVDGYVVSQLTAGTWVRSGCRWSAAKRRAARSGELERLVKARVRAMYQAGADGEDACVAAAPVAAELATTYQQLVAYAGTTHVKTPAFVDALAHVSCSQCDAVQDDLVTVIGENMSWYVEWPHVDGLFTRVFETLADHYAPDAYPTINGLDPNAEDQAAMVFN